MSAALRYAEVALALDEAGLALRNMGSLPHICVVGAAATGTHGSGDANQILPASVTAFDMVGADGELQHFDRSDPAFEGSVVALGALSTGAIPPSRGPWSRSVRWGSSPTSPST